MNASKTRSAHTDLPATGKQIKPVALALTSQVWLSAASEDHARRDLARPQVNPLWMITAGLGAFLALLALLVAFG